MPSFCFLISSCFFSPFFMHFLVLFTSLLSHRCRQQSANWWLFSLGILFFFHHHHYHHIFTDLTKSSHIATSFNIVIYSPAWWSAPIYLHVVQQNHTFPPPHPPRRYHQKHHHYYILTGMINVPHVLPRHSTRIHFSPSLSSFSSSLSLYSHQHGEVLPHMLGFSARARIMGEGSTNQFPACFFFF